jgi:hypothetical protein
MGHHPALGQVTLEALINVIHAHQLMHMRDLSAAAVMIRVSGAVTVTRALPCCPTAAMPARRPRPLSARRPRLNLALQSSHSTPAATCSSKPTVDEVLWLFHPQEKIKAYAVAQDDILRCRDDYILASWM